jgi:hypothetical protein
VGTKHLRRDARGTLVVLLHEARQNRSVVGLAGGVQQEHVPTDHLAAANREKLHGGLVVLAGQTQNVLFGGAVGSHLLALHGPLDRLYLVAQGCRSLVFGGVRGRLHLPGQLADHVLLAAVEETLDLLDLSPVVRLADIADARRLAAFDVVQQARPLDRLATFVDVQRARPKREDAADEVHRLVDAARRRVRPEVAAAVGRKLARPLDPREFLARDLDERVALVVLETDVVARPMPLDEVDLEKQRLADRVGHRVLEIGDLVDDRLRIRWLRRRRSASASSFGRGCAGSGPCRRT